MAFDWFVSMVLLRGRGSGGSVVAPMLTTLVEVGKRLGPRRRLLLCHLGEPILRSLLVLFTWNSLQLKVNQFSLTFIPSYSLLFQNGLA